jgi:hypothetical protein
LPADAGASHSGWLTNREYQSFLPKTFATSRPQRQRRISRRQHGLRVSRRIPTRVSRGSLPAVDGHHSPPSREQQSTHYPYWGTLYSPSASRRKSRLSGPTGDYPVNTAGDDNIEAEHAQDELPITDSIPCDLGSPALKKPGRTTLQRQKRFGLADPVAWDVINRTLMQQQRLSALTGPDPPAETSAQQSPKKYNEGTSRNSSQHRTLNRFTRQLEKYADAAGAVRKVPVMTPTISESKASFHTVKPLIPYKDEFSAAGLAVTSAEQARRSVDRPCPAAQTRAHGPQQHLDCSSQTRKELHRCGDSPSGATTPKPCASLESYVEFSPGRGSRLHVVDPLNPRKARPKPKQYNVARRRLLSWFGKKASGKTNNGYKQHALTPARGQRQKKEQSKPSEILVCHSNYRSQPLRMNLRSTLQKTPERFKATPALPIHYVTPKRDACVALATAQFDQAERGAHHEQDTGHHTTVFDARPPLRKFGLHGKRNITQGVLPRASSEAIEIIDEETESILHPFDGKIWGPNSISRKGKDVGIDTENANPQPDTKSSGTTKESTAPSLPFAAKLATSTASSLQRALDEARHLVDEEDQRAQSSSNEKKSSQKTLPLLQPDSRHSAVFSSLPRKPRSTEKFIYVKRDMPPVEALQSKTKPLPPRPGPLWHAAGTTPGQSSDAKAPQMEQKATGTPRTLTGKRKNAVAELTKAEEMLKDLDVFLNDYDDADIKDRDVIKGLRVATHAAADDLYDAYIRHKTGLRIRRFLADLRSFEDINGPSPVELDKQARERRAESRRIQRIQNRTGQRV